MNDRRERIRPPPVLDRSADEECPGRGGEPPANGDSRFPSEVILALVERRDGAITVDELAEALSRRGSGNAEPDPEIFGDVHQWLYRTELQRLGSRGELAFDADRGLVGPGGGVVGSGGGDRESWTSDAGAAAATRGYRWAVAYALVTAVAAGLFVLAGGSVDPLGAVPQTAVLGAFILACCGIAVVQHRTE